MMHNLVEHSDHQSLRDEETIEAGTFWYHTSHKKTYIAVNSNLVESYDGHDVADRILFSLNDGAIFSFTTTFGDDIERQNKAAGRQNFVQVTRPFTVTPFPINE